MCLRIGKKCICQLQIWHCQGSGHQYEWDSGLRPKFKAHQLMKQPQRQTQSRPPNKCPWGQGAERMRVRSQWALRVGQRGNVEQEKQHEQVGGWGTRKNGSKFRKHEAQGPGVSG